MFVVVEEETFPSSVRISASSHESCGQDFGVIEYDSVFRSKIVEDIAHERVAYLSGLAVDDHHSCVVAYRTRGLRDEAFRQVVVVLVEFRAAIVVQRSFLIVCALNLLFFDDDFLRFLFLLSRLVTRR